MTFRSLGQYINTASFNDIDFVPMTQNSINT